ncbi:MAG TPA: polysaccharide deacetylase family protein [Polyangia bacterium]|nr:polysaccharide deacetylase family protein [Polyangia bacterium]
MKRGGRGGAASAVAAAWFILGGSARAAAPVRRVETTEPVVAITFDACATKRQKNGFDRAAWDVVRAEHVPITIFVSGRWVETHAAEMTELAADPLVSFGDHSYDHPHMEALPPARMAGEIDQTEAALGKHGKKSVAFRPPFGTWNARVIDVARARGLPTVTWDVVSADPAKATTTARLERNVLDHARRGSIIIFHINARGWHTAEALPTILRGLRGRGLRFVSLADLLALAPPK